MKPLAAIIAAACVYFVGCSSPTAEFDALRDASAAAVAGTNVVEVLQ